MPLSFIISVLKPLVKKLFEIKWLLTTRKRKNRKTTLCLYLYSKPLYEYLTKIFEFPEGKKSQKIRMPKIIRMLPPQKRIPFIVGIMDTDWGIINGNKFGTHCASKFLLEDIKQTLEELINFKLKIKKYVQKNKYISYQMYIPKNYEEKLFNLLHKYFTLRNPKRIEI